MKYEGKILEFLDGSLTDSESAELLHGLSVSPEKRVILEQHIQLKDMITSAQKPLKVPAALEQEMNRRFPAIAHYNRELVFGTTSIAGGSGISRISSFFSKKPVRLAAAGMLLLLFTSYLPVSTNERDPNAAATSEGEHSSTHLSTSSVLNSPERSTPANRSTLESVHEKTLAYSPERIVRQEKNINSFIKSTKAVLNQQTVLDGKENINAVVAELSNTNGNTLESYPVEIALLSSISTPRIEPPSQIATHSIGEPRYLSPFGKKYDRLQVSVLLRFEYGMGQAYFRVNTSGAIQNTRIESSPLFGIDYIASPYFSLGVEGGSAGIARVVPSEVYEKASNITRFVTSNTIEASNHFYTRLMARYTINPYDIFHIETGVGFGAAFGETAEPLVAATGALSYDLSEKLSMSGGVSFAGTFSNVAAQERSTDTPTSTDAMPVGYIQENTPASSTLFSPSLTFRFGLRYKPW